MNFLFRLLMLFVLDTACAEEPGLTLEHLTGPLYIVQDNFYLPENSMVYVGERAVTVIGATWTPETARLLHTEISRITGKPVNEVLNPNHHPDRAGGNAYWRSIGAEISSTELTYGEMTRNWDDVIGWVRLDIPDYPDLPMVLPDKVFPGDFECQGGRIRVFYLGQSRTLDGTFVWFPNENVFTADAS